MADFEEADQRLMDWLAERTDTQLQRLLDAPEDGLTNSHFGIYRYNDGVCRSCLTGWASDDRSGGAQEDDIPSGTHILEHYGIDARPLSHHLSPTSADPLPDRDKEKTIMRRIQRFAAAEMLTRRVERKALPAPKREAVTA